MELKRPRLARSLDWLRSSYWFVPGLVVASAALLACAIVRLDRAGHPALRAFTDWLGTEDVDAVRSVLTTIAGATVTIVSLTFSITIVSLTLASSQFGSRLLYSFMRDRMNQFVLGLLLGTFVYCLFAIAAAEPAGAANHSQLALVGAIGLSVSNVFVLIYFFHHVAESIQATHIISRVGRELATAIERALPSDGHVADPGRGEDGERASTGAPVDSSCRGVLQAVDDARLVALAEAGDFVLDLTVRPGRYVLEGEPLAYVLEGEPPTEADRDAIRSSFLFGERRTLVQDVEFAFHQLVEIAVRALSPGINDPFTAMGCIDELGSGLAQLASRGPFPSQLRDESGAVRVRLDAVQFEGFLDTTFAPLRLYAETQPIVAVRLIDTLTRIRPCARSQRHRAALEAQGRAVHEAATRRPIGELEREQLDRSLDALLRGSEDAGPDRQRPT